MLRIRTTPRTVSMDGPDSLRHHPLLSGGSEIRLRGHAREPVRIPRPPVEAERALVGAGVPVPANAGLTACYPVPLGREPALPLPLVRPAQVLAVLPSRLTAQYPRQVAGTRPARGGWMGCRPCPHLLRPVVDASGVVLDCLSCLRTTGSGFGAGRPFGVGRSRA